MQETQLSSYGNKVEQERGNIFDRDEEQIRNYNSTMKVEGQLPGMSARRRLNTGVGRSPGGQDTNIDTNTRTGTVVNLDRKMLHMSMKRRGNNNKLRNLNSL